MKSIGLIAGVFIAMILAAVVTRKCGYVYTDTYPTAEAQRSAVERGDTVKSGYNRETGQATVADTTRPTYYACGSRVNGSDWPVGVVGILVLVGGLWWTNRKPKTDDDSYAPTPTPITDEHDTVKVSRWTCRFDDTVNEAYRVICTQCGRPRKDAERV